MSDESEILIKGAGKVSFFILLSRITGLFREMSIAIFIGANYITDALFVGWAVPNTLRRFLAEGLVAPAFVPAFVKAKEDGRVKEALSSSLGQISLITGIISFLLILFSDYITDVLAPGFEPKAKDLSSFFISTLSPYILLISVATVLSAFLNSFYVFGVPASTMFIFNIINIAAIVSFYYLYGRPELGFIFGVFLGVIFQNIINLWSSSKITKIGFTFRNTEYSKMIWTSIPAVIVGGAVYQINFLVSRAIASFGGEKTVSFITYASRFFEFPLGVFVYSISYVALPFLAGKKSARSFSMSVYITTLIILPATVGLFVLSEPIINLVFGYGKFTAQDVVETSRALSMYSLGLLPVAMSRILVSDFQATRRLRIPVISGIFSFVSNTVLCVIFILLGMQHSGIALASSISALFGFIPLIINSDKKEIFLGSFVDGLKVTLLPSLITLGLCFGYITLWKSYAFSRLLAFVLMMFVIVLSFSITLFFAKALTKGNNKSSPETKMENS